ncbi:hypothetical protein BV25DRAFT_1291794 [Artomyces pyxidatus]|uniref:Uncharacterized protein n=1 Tax=Artomyces pyxidatus TaxID=48021 RepID=A0ACB8SR60_9AGAM|nr:hypothetical protein BV25DRAFT_1291794 [Artomyces pyxidatus]
MVAARKRGGYGRGGDGGQSQRQILGKLVILGIVKGAARWKGWAWRDSCADARGSGWMTAGSAAFWAPVVASGSGTHQTRSREMERGAKGEGGQRCGSRTGHRRGGSLGARGRDLLRWAV